MFHPMVPYCSSSIPAARNNRAISSRAFLSHPSLLFIRVLCAPGSLFTFRQRSNSSPIDLSTAERKSMSLKLALMNPLRLLFAFSWTLDKKYWLFLWNNCSCSNYADWIAKSKSRAWRKSTRSFSPAPIYRPRSSPCRGCKLAEMRH